MFSDWFITASVRSVHITHAPLDRFPVLQSESETVVGGASARLLDYAVWKEAEEYSSEVWDHLPGPGHTTVEG
ncbi:hypothetical protein AMELA_G00152980 [Ameiurus melas]|uniref:Uncharacterized protein n=1 Tax=Ameiurus melas TaxID=219545 RepID=A0A7J6AIL7_AMEME|nr:hypothetical protein AMELA_G00152980 [Ameiurus melas]